jgi:hypothetical protein
MGATKLHPADKRQAISEAAVSLEGAPPMPTRTLTDGEKALLKSVFGDTLPYDTQEITTNDSNLGGAGNSITPLGTPHFSTQIWVDDFSDPAANRWTFVHEFGHVWQYRFGTQPIIGALANEATFSNYDDSYPYDLTTSTNFLDYNIEQEASIVADYWAVSNSQSARKCTNPASPTVSSYLGLMGQVWRPANQPTETASGAGDSGDSGSGGPADGGAPSNQPSDPALDGGAAPGGTDPPSSNSSS